MTSEAIETQPFDIGRVFNRAFGAIGRNIGPFALLALIFSAAPQVIIGLLSIPNDGILDFEQQPYVTGAILIGAGLVSIVGAFLLQAGVIHGSIDDMNGRKTSLGDCLATATRHFWPVVGISILVSLGTGLGLILLVVPGLILTVMWLVSVPVQVVERRGVTGSMERSSALTKGSRWPVFGLVAIFVVFSWIVSGIAAGLAAAFSGGFMEGMSSLVMQAVLTPLINVVSAVIGAAGTAATYYELRSIKEGIVPSSLASVFD